VVISVEVTGDHFEPALRSINVGVSPPHEGWARSFGRRSVGGTRGVGVDGNGNVYAVGSFRATCDFDPGFSTVSVEAIGEADAFIVKLDSGGVFEWVRTWGGAGTDEVRGLGTDSYGNNYVGGVFQGKVDFDPGEKVAERTAKSTKDAFLMKINAAGDLEWVRTWGDEGSRIEIADIALDPGSDVFVTGAYTGTIDLDPGETVVQTTPYGGADTYLSKFSPGGSLRWARVWGGDNPDSDLCTGLTVAADGAGSAYVGGSFSGRFSFHGTSASIEQLMGGFICKGGMDAFMCKVLPDGDFEWCRAWGGPGDESCYGAAARGGSVLATGGFEQTVDLNPGDGVSEVTAQSDGDAYLIRFSTSGAFIWARTWVDAIGIAVDLDPSNDILVVGAGDGSIDFDPGPDRIPGLGSVYLAQFDMGGNYIWARVWGRTNEDMGTDVITERNGNIYVTGKYRGGLSWDPEQGLVYTASALDADAFVAKFIPGGEW
jgi:hypothetical protein